MFTHFWWIRDVSNYDSLYLIAKKLVKKKKKKSMSSEISNLLSFLLFSLMLVTFVFRNLSKGNIFSIQNYFRE